MLANFHRSERTYRGFLKENSSSDVTSANNLPDEKLFSLAFDCTKMVTELSKSYKLERQGDHYSAMSTIGTVERRIGFWMERIDRQNTEFIDKEKLCQDLEEAKKALSLDL